ncbi:MAG: site-specific integrase [Chloroflexia bacterium]|nr:site-specific integrase [Chloroflexia bacterium]
MAHDYGEGTIYQEGKGRWRAALVIDGKVVRRRAKSEREAKALLKQLRQQRQDGLNVGDGQQSLARWLQHWLDVILPGKDLKARTLDTHRYMVEHYIIPKLGEIKLAKLTPQHIDRWQRTLREQGLSVGTITNARRRLRTALEVARKRKLISDNVVSLTENLREPVRRLEPGTSVLTEEQIKQLLTELRTHRLYALYVLAASLGLRMAEVMGLRWAAFDAEQGTLIIREQLQRIGGEIHREFSTKSGKHRTLYLSARHIDVLQAHRERQAQERQLFGELWQGQDLIFVSANGTPLEAGALRRQFKRSLVRAGLPKVTFHSLRHSAGSIMLANGAQLVDVSKILGHANPSITARIYSHSYETGQRHAVLLAANALFDA